MQPTYEDANPNMRFIENLILVRLVQEVPFIEKEI